MHAYRSAFEEPGARAQRADNGGRSDAAGLDIGGNAEAAQFSAGCSLTAPVLEARVVGGLQREIQCREVIAAVVLQRDRRLVRVCLLRDEIAAAQFCRIHAELIRGEVDEALEQDSRLRA